ncbi:MAG: hypothetical protein P1U86_04255 [Verrucomicrobiales bacterium]|nr:hypothetical protein [Verrucomicrobiales bacterium]
MELNRDTLAQSLILLGEYLEAEKSDPIRLIVTGGAALQATGITGRTTYDLDILATRGTVDGEISPAHPLPEHFNEAAEAVAVEMKLASNWANANTSLLMIGFERLPGEIWTDLLVKNYGPCLEVSFMGRTGQIYLKIWAAMDRDRESDLSDLRQLNITEAEARKVIHWLIDEELISLRAPERAEEVMKKIGHEGIIPKFS